ncbi:uncharacterized protein LOC106365083 isoform X2 [Brassica napus]|uniref:uncharacterized protein LOC106365083 isoform X2 n=1 Tax=Brassica napus TaxID=3708 RepID=UPI002078911E|nr:uncharacterized protein LOC106365083 isoform X2 [Brassica napus]
MRLKTEWWMVHFIHQSDMLLVWLVSTLPTPSPGKTIRTSKRSVTRLLTVVLQWPNDLSQIRKTEILQRRRKAKRESIILPQSPHLVAMKTNQEDQDQVLKDQRRRRSTSPAETNALLKVKTKPMALVPLSRFFGNLKS